MKTVADLDKDYQEYEVGENHIDDYEDFYNYMGKVIDDIQGNWADVVKQMTENIRWRKISTIRNLFPIVFVKEDTSFYDYDNEILADASELIVNNLGYYERIRNVSNNDNFQELCKLTNFLLDRYEDNINCLNYKRDEIIAMIKGEKAKELDYQYNFQSVDLFAEKHISAFEDKKQLIKK